MSLKILGVGTGVATGGVTASGTLTSGQLVKGGGGKTLVVADLTGDVTTSGATATTVAKIQGTTVSTPTGTGAVVLATSPTITTPTIASFTNATHNHQNAAGGGTLDTAAIASGTLGIANGGTGVTGGAMVRINQVITTASAGTIVFSSIPATYTDLQIRLSGRMAGTATGEILCYLKFNADGTSGNYMSTQFLYGRNNTTSAAGNSVASTANGAYLTSIMDAKNGTDPITRATIDISDYARTTFEKTFTVFTGGSWIGTGNNVSILFGQWKSTAAVTTLTITPASSTFTDGTIATLYGIP